MTFRSNAPLTFAMVLAMGCSSSAPKGGGGPGGNGSSGSSGGSGGNGSSGSGENSSGGTSGGSGGASGSGGGSGGVSTGEGGASDAGGMGTLATDGGDQCPAGVLGHCDPGGTYPQYPGYTLALVEDFPAPVDLDNDPIFTWSDGSPESGQVRFRKEQISFANGSMIITANSTCPKPAAACIPMGTSYAESAPNSNSGTVAAMNVWSGEFRTKYNNYRYGRYEVRYHAPSANPGHETDPANSGNFLSTMFLFRTPKWQNWNEIDLELEPSIPLSVAYNVVNAVNMDHYPMNNNAAGDTGNALTGYKNIDTHTYAFVWTPSIITWYLDGAMIHQFTGTASDPIPSKSVKIMMNLWIFGNAPTFGDPSKNKYPFSSQYEYFRFYKWDQETTYPCSPTPSCLPATDTAFSRNNPTEVNYPN